MKISTYCLCWRWNRACWLKSFCVWRFVINSDSAIVVDQQKLCPTDLINIQSVVIRHCTLCPITFETYLCHVWFSLFWGHDRPIASVSPCWQWNRACWLTMKQSMRTPTSITRYSLLFLQHAVCSGVSSLIPHPLPAYVHHGHLINFFCV